MTCIVRMKICIRCQFYLLMTRIIIIIIIIIISIEAFEEGLIPYWVHSIWYWGCSPRSPRKAEVNPFLLSSERNHDLSTTPELDRVPSLPRRQSLLIKFPPQLHANDVNTFDIVQSQCFIWKVPDAFNGYYVRLPVTLPRRLQYQSQTSWQGTEP